MTYGNGRPVAVTEEDIRDVMMTALAVEPDD